MSFLIVEYIKEKPETDAKFWRGGSYNYFHAGIYRASNFRSKQAAVNKLKQMQNFNSPVPLDVDKSYKVAEFQEAKKMTSNPGY
jgi:hypothetical protein